LSIPKLELAVTIEPLIADQEMQVSFVYWEGAIEVVGALEEAPIRGKGYVELTGYGEQSSAAYQR
jgi:predicted secreted hydrolase